MKLRVTSVFLALFIVFASSFVVKNITATISGKSGGPITRAELTEATELQLDHDAYEIVSFKMSCLTEIDGKSDIVELFAESSAFTPEMQELFTKINVGDKLYIEQITALKGSKEIELEALEFILKD